MDQPLHVRVALVLGWTKPEQYVHYSNVFGGDHPGEWVAEPPGGPELFDNGWVSGEIIAKPIPRYDLDWSATGPLIERYHIELSPPTPEDGSTWGATRWDRPGNAEGSTALVAVCKLLLALHAAGKLER